MKIAIGYASFSGVSKCFISNLTNNELLVDDKTLTNIVTQYYPTTDQEKLYEVDKHNHEDWYPNHQLFLFNIKNNLYCYVELFGAIQKYVLLSSNYSGGNLCKKYIQKTIKWEFIESDWVVRSMSDLHILAQQFDVNFDQDIEMIQKEVIQKAKSRSYVIEPQLQIEKVKNLIQELILYTITDKKGFDIVDDLRKKAATAKERFGFTLVDKQLNNPLHGHREIYADFSKFRIGSDNHSCPIESKIISENLKIKYSAYKLYELLCSNNLQNTIKFSLANKRINADGENASGLAV